jgi:hypothetical protein
MLHAKEKRLPLFQSLINYFNHSWGSALFHPRLSLFCASGAPRWQLTATPDLRPKTEPKGQVEYADVLNPLSPLKPLSPLISSFRAQRVNFAG